MTTMKSIMRLSVIVSLILWVMLFGAYYGNSTLNIKAQTCDFEALKGSVCLNIDEQKASRNDVAKYHRVIYNRAPKSASMTMSRILELHARSTNYTFMWITGYQYVITSDERKLYLNKMASVKNQRFVLTSHHYYFPFHEYINHTLIYINLIREPVSWFISAYSYFRSQSEHFKNKWWNKRPIMNCVNDLKCVKHIVNTFGAVRFLCGSSEVCNDSLSTNAVQLAKRHVRNDYLIVGITEEMQSFIVMLERLMPDMFANLSRTAGIKRRNVTKKKVRRTAELERKLLSLLSFEMDLYKYVQQRFYKFKQALDV